MEQLNWRRDWSRTAWEDVAAEVKTLSPTVKATARPQSYVETGPGGHGNHLNMPVHCIIDSRDELITITAGGEVRYGNVSECLDAMVDAKALGYRKLVDCAAAVFVMSLAELAALSVKVRELHGTGAMGAAAFIINIEPSAPEVQLLGAIAAADRPLRLFKSKPQAKRWIDGLAAKRSTR